MERQTLGRDKGDLFGAAAAAAAAAPAAGGKLGRGNREDDGRTEGTRCLVNEGLGDRIKLWSRDAEDGRRT